ncbi:MAG: FG-GAP-like repeat-containing protein, partial [Fidelibacterota bacterium]
MAKADSLHNKPFWQSREYGKYQDVKYILLDDDLLPDIIAYSHQYWGWSAPELEIFINQGGYYSQDPTYTVSLPGNGIGFYDRMKIIDVDNDGDSDVSIYNENAFYIYKNNNGYLSSTPTQTLNIYCTGYSWGNLNNDQYPDLAIRQYGGSEPNRVYLNNGGVINDTPEWTGLSSGNQGQGVVWVDYDIDGDEDIIFGNELFINNNGVIGSNVFDFTDYSNNTQNITYGNIDSDPFPEIAFSSEFHNGSRNTIWDYDGASGFTVVWSSDINPSRDIKLVDVDGDGDQDCYLSTAVFGGDGSQGHLPRPNYIFFNVAGQIQSMPGWASSEAKYTLNSDWADYDNDGDLDLLTASGYSQVWDKIELFVNADYSLNLYPIIIDVFPANNAKSIDDDAVIDLWISPNIEGASVNNGIVMMGSISGAINYNYIQDVPGNIQIYPLNNFSFSEDITITITSELTTINGISNPQQQQISYTVETNDANQYLLSTPFWQSREYGKYQDVKYIL